MRNAFICKLRVLHKQDPKGTARGRELLVPGRGRWEGRAQRKETSPAMAVYLKHVYIYMCIYICVYIYINIYCLKIFQLSPYNCTFSEKSIF